ncbi:hypothetical protein ACIRYZ_45545 [Kitasatospora sp. NPDC101155]|uniref:hypothetical protein n=1 Tax=Kitasatospora sp. NPDC101155 TaxID=3364097 RepID=UPI0038211D2E
MTAAARAQLPDQLATLVQQQLLDRLPDGALRTTPAGRVLAGVHDDLAAWYGQHLDAATRSQAAAARTFPAGSSPAQTPPPPSGPLLSCGSSPGCSTHPGVRRPLGDRPVPGTGLPRHLAGHTPTAFDLG